MSIFGKLITSNLSRGATHSMRRLSTWSTTPLHSNLLFQSRNPMPQIISPNPTSLEEMSIFRKSITSNLSRGATHSTRRLATLSTPIDTPWYTPRHSYFLFDPRFPMPQIIRPPCSTSSEDDEFLQNVAVYTESLRAHSRYGVPYTWSDAILSFNHYHREQIVKIQSLTSYYVTTVITPKEYMLLYLRCTLEDIPSVLMYLRERRIGVAVGDEAARHSPATNFIRLSGLSVANDPCMVLRTDASILNGEGGYGHVLSDSADNYVGCGYGPIINIPEGLTVKQIVTLAELYAIQKALEEFQLYSKEAALPIIPRVRIMTDSLNAVQILHGNPVVANMAEADGNKYCLQVLDALCQIGCFIKPLSDYYPNHIYRDVNDDCDMLARMGRLNHHPSLEKFISCRKSERLRFY